MTDSKKTVLILGFFDGIHLGHREVIKSAVKYAGNNYFRTVLLTFPKSPAEYFHKKPEYIYPREYNYEIIKDLGINSVEETDFEKLVNIEATDYIKMIVEKYSPAAIFTGYNYTFGKERKGNSETLKEYQKVFGYEYFCIPEYKLHNITVCSSKIKEFLKKGDLISANEFLGKDFVLESKVIYGKQVGRTIGFPTANFEYPQNIVRLPYGVYRGRSKGLKAMINWGIKPTINQTEKEVVETHIINFKGDLYGKNLRVEFTEKLRDEIKFDSLEELRLQIEKDKKACLR